MGLESVERCEHCGSTKIVKDGCVTCGAPECCQTCCQITTLEAQLNKLRKDAYLMKHSYKPTTEGLR